MALSLRSTYHFKQRTPTMQVCHRPTPSKVAEPHTVSSRARRLQLVTAASTGRLDNTSCPKLPSFTGEVDIRGTPSYTGVVGQYASLNHVDDDEMKPYAIIQAAGDDDIIQALSWARKNKVAVAVRTGGHQYSGASSTTGCNIQLDVSNTYPDLQWLNDTTVEVGISRRLSKLNKELRERDSFVPHGQCAHVHVGGHAHTGGYGLPGRAFGLFGDHIIAIRVITADGPDNGCNGPRWIERDTKDPKEAELFWAVLGGSPGNFAVLTKIRLRVHKGADHPKARGIKLFGLYNSKTLERLLKLKAEMSADPDLPADFDMCLTVMAGPGAVLDQEPQMLALVEGDDAAAAAAANANAAAEDTVVEKYGVMTREELEEYLQTEEGYQALNDMNEELDDNDFAMAADSIRPLGLGDAATKFLQFIVVFAEWANLEGADQPDDAAVAWLDRIRNTGRWIPVASGEWGPNTKDHGMPFMTSQWVFPIKREYDLPYDKRTYVTNATNLDTSGWVEFTRSQIDDILSFSKHGRGCRLVVQIQHYGGKHSRFRTKGDDGKTSYSWRDTTVAHVMDAFYRPKGPAKQLVEEWQEVNDKGYKGPNGNFSPNQDRRVFWASYEANGTDELDLGKYWYYYHENEDKWNKLRVIKGRVDPDKVLSPNPFAVPPLTQ